MYGHLFKSEEPPDAEWEEDLNPNSEVVHSSALVDPSVWNWNPKHEYHLQVWK